MRLLSKHIALQASCSELTREIKDLVHWALAVHNTCNVQDREKTLETLMSMSTGLQTKCSTGSAVEELTQFCLLALDAKCRMRKA